MAPAPRRLSFVLLSSPLVSETVTVKLSVSLSGVSSLESSSLSSKELSSIAELSSIIDVSISGSTVALEPQTSQLKIFY